MMVTRRHVLFLVVSIVWLTGCGYTVGAPGLDRPDGGSGPTIAVPLLENGTSEPRLGQIVTDRLKSQLLSASPWQVVNRRDEPELTLSGRVKTLTLTPMAFDVDSRVTEYRLELHVQITLTRSSDGTVLWSAREMVGASDYYVNEDIAATRESKERSIRDASQRIAETTVQQLRLSSLVSPPPTP